jgi:hypothetical protein
MKWRALSPPRCVESFSLVRGSRQCAEGKAIPSALRGICGCPSSRRWSGPPYPATEGESSLETEEKQTNNDYLRIIEELEGLEHRFEAFCRELVSMKGGVLRYWNSTLLLYEYLYYESEEMARTSSFRRM